MNVKENIVIVGNESSCSFQMCMQGFITVIVNKRQIQNIDLYTCIYSLIFWSFVIAHARHMTSLSV